MKANIDIRLEMTKAGVYQWQVAKAYGLSDHNFSRLLREELSKEKKLTILEAIEKVANTKDA